MQRQRTTTAAHGELGARKPRLRVASRQMRAGSRPVQQARAGAFRIAQAR